MTQQISRREFFSRKGIGQVLKTVSPMFGVAACEHSGLQDDAPQENPQAEAASTPTGERNVMAGYFSSSLYSYALLSEMPWDMLIEEAKRYNIPYEGRSKLDIVRELFVGTGGREDEPS